MNDLLWQWLALSLYAFFVGFCFCDGFAMPTARKLIWFIIFLGVSIYSFQRQGYFNLTLILSVSAPAAFVLCFLQKKNKFP